jgi:hypothetical protein
MPDNKVDLNTLLNIHGGVIDYFNALHKRGEENERYYSADPFTDKQKNEYALQDRIPFSISSIPQKLNSIISTERTNRVSWKAKAKIEPDDISEDPQQMQQLFLKEIKAKLATLRMKMIESQNSAQWKYSDIFASGVAIIYGVAKIFPDVNKYGDTQIKLQDVDYKNLIWDKNSVEYERNDAQWMAEKRYIYRVDLKRYYDKKKVNDLTITDAASRWGRKKTQYFVQYNRSGNSDLDLITLIEHYQKVLRDYHTVLFNGQIVSCERVKADAEKTLRILQLPYLAQGLDLPPADVIKTPKLALDKYLFTYNDELDYEETDLEVFPYSVYQAFQFKDKIWTMADILKSMQQLANRMLAQIDYAFGQDLKNKWEIFLPALEGTGLSLEESLQMLDEKGYILTNIKEAIKSIKGQGANPQWVEIMQIMLGLIDEIGGGKTFSGNANSANQSGKAINALIGQGQLLTTAFIDNRNRFLTDLGNKLLWFMKRYDNTPYILRIEGGALSPEMLQLLQQNKMFAPSIENPSAGYVTLNQDNQNYLETADYDLDIVEESLSDNKKELEFASMSQIEKADPDLLLSPTWRKKKLEKISSLSYEDRQKIGEEIEQIKQAQQTQATQMQQQQVNLERAKVLISDKGTQTETVNK